MRQWLGPWDITLHPTLGPRRLSHRDSINGLFCPLASSGIQPMEGSSQRKALRAEEEWGWVFIYSPSFFLAESLGLATYLFQNRQILSGSPLHIALNTRIVPSPISSILGVEMDPSASNSVLASLNPANTLINNPFNKRSSSYPIWMCFLAGPWLTHVGQLSNVFDSVPISVKPV